MTNELKSFRTRNTATPQSEKAAKGQKRNNAGGYSFTVSELEQAKRFIILGSASNFYTPGNVLTKENAKVLIKLAEKDSRALVDLIVQISTEGRAAKQQPGLFALAVASSFGAPEDKGYALSKLPVVARTTTTLTEFVSYALQFRGWGRAFKNAVANWYVAKPVNDLAYQIAKYGQRSGWSHGDLLRVSHPKGDAAFNGLAQYVLHGDTTEVPQIIADAERLKAATSETEAVEVLKTNKSLTWEMVPSELRGSEVWTALVNAGMPLGALIRQLPTLTRQGVLKPLSITESIVVSALTDEAAIQKARIHPLNVLIAYRTYEAGRSYRGSSTWNPNARVLEALDKAFYLAFKNVEPTGKRFLLALDVSGSMGMTVQESFLTARDVAGAFSLVFAKTEAATHTIGFTGGSNGFSGFSRAKAKPAGKGQYASSVSLLNIRPSMSLGDVTRTMSGLPFGGTDCALPMLYALEQGIETDVFVVITDSETWEGRIHAHEALTRYRKQVNPNAKLAVLGTTASRFTIGDPNDAGTLNVAGFDSAVPQLVSEFVKGF